MDRIAFVVWIAVLAAAGAAQSPEPVVRTAAELAAPDDSFDARLQEEVGRLDEIVVTATRSDEELFSTPATVNVVRGRELTTRRSPATLPDALRDVPGVMVQKTGPGLGSPFIRGLTGFRTVLLIDGIRLNNAVFRDGPNQYWATVDPLSLGHLEVVKGPTSVLWGSDAAGGTVGAYTEALDLGDPGSGLDGGGRAYYRFNSAEASHVARLAGEVRHDGRFAARVGATYKSFGDTDAGGDFGRQDGLSYDDRALDAKLRGVIDDHVELEFLYQGVRLGDVPRAHSTRNGVSFHGTSIGSDRRRDFDQDRDLALVTAYLYDGSFFDEAQVKIAYQRQDEVEHRVRANGRRDESGFDVDTLAFTTQFTSGTRLGTFVYGVDLYVDLVDSFARRTNPGSTVTTSAAQGPVGDDSTYVTLGVYAQDTYEIGDWGKVVFGGRYSHVEVESNRVLDPLTGNVTSLEDDFDAVSGSLRFLAAVSEEFNLFTSVGTGFRAPNLSDLTRLDSARSNEIETPSPGLDPEYFLGFEVGFKLRTERVQAEVAYYNTLLFDTITRAPTGNVIDGEVEVRKTNAGDGFIQGVELQAAWRVLDDVTLSGLFAWSEGEADTFPTSQPLIAREPLSRIQPLQGRIALLWEPSFLAGFWAEAATEFAGGQDRLSSSDRADVQRIPPNGTPGYTLYHLRLGYDFDEQKSVFLHLENLSDKNYRIHGSGSQEAGFSAVVGFDLRF